MKFAHSPFLRIFFVLSALIIGQGLLDAAGSGWQETASRFIREKTPEWAKKGAGWLKETAMQYPKTAAIAGGVSGVAIARAVYRYHHQQKEYRTFITELQRRIDKMVNGKYGWIISQRADGTKFLNRDDGDPFVLELTVHQPDDFTKMFITLKNSNDQQIIDVSQKLHVLLRLYGMVLREQFGQLPENVPDKIASAKIQLYNEWFPSDNIIFAGDFNDRMLDAFNQLKDLLLGRPWVWFKRALAAVGIATTAYGLYRYGPQMWGAFQEQFIAPQAAASGMRDMGIWSRIEDLTDMVTRYYVKEELPIPSSGAIQLIEPLYEKYLQGMATDNLDMRIDALAEIGRRLGIGYEGARKIITGY